MNKVNVPVIVSSQGEVLRSTPPNQKAMSDVIMALRTYNKPTGYSDWRARAMILGDGTSISVQASKFHYSLPREDTPPEAGYSHYEVWGFPDEQEDPERWEAQRVIDYIVDHKGIDVDATFAQDIS